MWTIWLEQVGKVPTLIFLGRDLNPDSRERKRCVDQDSNPGSKAMTPTTNIPKPPTFASCAKGFHGVMGWDSSVGPFLVGVFKNIQFKLVNKFISSWCLRPVENTVCFSNVRQWISKTQWIHRKTKPTSPKFQANMSGTEMPEARWVVGSRQTRSPVRWAPPRQQETSCNSDTAVPVKWRRNALSTKNRKRQCPNCEKYDRMLLQQRTWHF